TARPAPSLAVAARARGAVRTAADTASISARRSIITMLCHRCRWLSQGRGRLYCRAPCRGGMAEWLKAHAWKACIRETVSWVRIPLPPPVMHLAASHNVLAIGVYPDVSLACAREEALNARRLINAGIDPVAERRRARANNIVETFQAIAEEWIESRKNTWSPSYSEAVRSALIA